MEILFIQQTQVDLSNVHLEELLVATTVQQIFSFILTDTVTGHIAYEITNHSNHEIPRQPLPKQQQHHQQQRPRPHHQQEQQPKPHLQQQRQPKPHNQQQRQPKQHHQQQRQPKQHLDQQIQRFHNHVSISKILYFLT